MTVSVPVLSIPFVVVLLVVLFIFWRVAETARRNASRDTDMCEGSLEESRRMRRRYEEVIADLEESLRHAEFGREDAQRAIKALQRQLRELAGEESA